MRAHLSRRDVAARVGVHLLEGLGEPLVALVDGRGEDLLEGRLAAQGLQRRLERALADVADLLRAVLGAVDPLLREVHRAADAALDQVGPAADASLDAAHQPAALLLRLDVGARAHDRLELVERDLAVAVGVRRLEHLCGDRLVHRTAVHGGDVRAHLSRRDRAARVGIHLREGYIGLGLGLGLGIR